MCWQIMQLGQDALCGVQFGVLRADAIWPSGYYGLVLVLLGFYLWTPADFAFLLLWD